MVAKKAQKKVLVCAAWPYVYAVPHLGNLVCMFAGDSISRYFKLAGYDVEYVSGSDEHGTKMEHEARKLGITPQELVDRIHAQVVELLGKLNISFTNYSRTGDKRHKVFVESFYKTVEKNGYVAMKEEKLPYCKSCDMFLADRYLIGTCPHCGNKESQGNQCDDCGRVLDPTELKDSRCSTCGSKPEIRPTVNAFFDLPKLSKQLLAYVDEKSNVWQPRVVQFTKRWIEEGLHQRSMTRDVAWGIKSPFASHSKEQRKTLYCWVEAVLGYVSTLEMQGRLKEFWKEPIEHSYFCLGKDNIPFHTILFPGLLMAHGGYNVPDIIVSNEFLQFFSKKFSKTKGVGIWIDEMPELLDADYWRYYIFRIFPDIRDTNFDWADFEDKINNELVANIANYSSRVLTLAQTYFKGNIPEFKLGADEQDILDEITDLREKVHEAFVAGNVRDGLDAALQVSRRGNEYLQKKEPWTIEKNRYCVGFAAAIMRAVGLFIAPYLPTTFDKIKELYAIPDKDPWDNLVLSGVKVGKSCHLFERVSAAELEKKLDEIRSRKAFSKLDLRVAKIVAVNNHPKADKLYVLSVECPEKRTIVAGLKMHLTPDQLLNKSVLIVANLEPADLRGVKSEGMVLAAEDKKGKLSLLETDAKVGESASVSSVESNPLKSVSYDEFTKVKIVVKTGYPQFDGKNLMVGKKTVICNGVADDATVR